jgi:hypothetical protein
MKSIELAVADAPAPRKTVLRRLAARAAIWGVVALLASLAWQLGYQTYQAHTLPKTVHALIEDASGRLSDALANGADASADAALAERLDRHAVLADQLVMKLRDVDTGPIEELSAAADDYLLTAREILRRRAAAYRYRAHLNERLQALRIHMRSDNRTAAWVSQAVRLKGEVDAEFRRYRITATALIGLLEQYESSRARVRPHLPQSATLMESSMADAARTRLLDALAKETEELQRASQLGIYR